jgi:hypothetical protein
MRSPTIKATFELDERGQPLLVQRDNLNHYRIRLQVEGAPEDTYAVTYVLHETYYAPVRESRDRAHEFAEELTSYGNYTVQAKIRTKNECPLVVTSSLSEALRVGHPDQQTAEIEAALKYIGER